MESMVASAAPRGSLPAGRITNMKSGSSAMLTIPPIMIPRLACMERPSARMRWAKRLLSAVQRPPDITAIFI